MIKRLCITAAILFLAACQQAPVKDEDSPLVRLAPGSTVTLHEALTIPAGHARVFMQNGKVEAKTHINRYHPHCNFEVRSVSDGTSRIEPDTFIVTDVIEDETNVVAKQQSFMRVGWRLTGGDSTLLLTRLVEHRLQSEGQPQVMRLTCYGGFDEPWRVAYPTIGEIRRSLGTIATIKRVSQE